MMDVQRVSADSIRISFIYLLTVLSTSIANPLYRLCPEYYCKRIHWTQNAGMCSARRLAIVSKRQKERSVCIHSLMVYIKLMLLLLI